MKNGLKGLGLRVRTDSKLFVLPSRFDLEGCVIAFLEQLQMTKDPKRDPTLEQPHVRLIAS